MSYRIIIVEDEYFVAEDIKNILVKYGHEPIGNADNYHDALVLIAEYTPDVVLLDINLGEGKGGIELAAILRDKYDLPFIFITSYADPATLDQVKALHPLGYLMKPFSEKSVLAAIEVGMANYGQEDTHLRGPAVHQDFFFVRDKRMMKKVKFEDIQCLEADDNYVYIHTAQTRFIVYLSLKEMLKKLPTWFVRVHRSHVVNIQYVTGIKSDEICLSEEKRIPLGRSYKQQLIAQLNFLSPR